MILSDCDIKAALQSGMLIIDGLEDEDVQIQPCSVDLRLSNDFCKYKTFSSTILDTRGDMEDMTEMFSIPDGSPLILHPGEFVLGSTIEWIKLPPTLMGHLQGRSSIARCGITTNCLAGLVDPGSYCNLTLQLCNLSPIPVALYPGMRICQISFSTLTSEVDRPYGDGRNSKYHGSIGPTPSKIGHDHDAPKDVPLKNIQLPEPYPSQFGAYKGAGPGGLTPTDKLPSP